MRRLALALALSLAAVGVQANEPVAPPVTNDYPTAARAEYVFACMATNGQTPEALSRCSCSIDQVASVLPYEAYVEAETVLRMRLMAGERGAMFRGTPAVREIAADLRRAQAEAEILCF
jgi:hypothetical protein